MAQLNYLTDEPSLFMSATPENIGAAASRGARTADLQHPRGGAASSALARG